ncbi:MAG: hypothetical protein ACTSX6_13240, partial [Candidatus Heimdallarchaeaceae archaeon]
MLPKVNETRLIIARKSLYKYFLFACLVWMMCSLSISSTFGFSPHSLVNNQPKSVAGASITDFSVNVLNFSSVTVSWNITGEYVGVKVFRKFIDKTCLVGVFNNKTTEYAFTNHVYGTEYSYYIEVIDRKGNSLETSESVKVITPIDSNDKGAPDYSWEDYRSWRFPGFSEDYLNYTYETHDVYTYHLHGVKVVIAFGKDVSTIYSKQKAAEKWFNIFNRLWYKFLCFPIDEYRIVIENDGALVDENTLGLFYPPSEIEWLMSQSGSKQSHEVCHAWIGSVIGVERNYGGEGFDPETEDSDKWI